MEQTNSRARRRLGPELQELADGLDKDAFKALSPGIGLGNVRPKGAAPRQHIPVSSQVTQGESDLSRVTVVPAASVATSAPRKASATDAPAPQKRKFGFAKRILALGIDFLFVATSVCTALAIAAIFAAANSGGEIHWTALAPVEWIAAFSPLEILAGVYGTFAAYWLLFRLLVGGTLGESMLMRRKRSAKMQASEPRQSPV